MARQDIGASALEHKGWWMSYRWLILRRISQISIMALFIFAPIWLVKGNLASNVVLETVPLTDPFLYIQSLLSGYGLELAALIGAGIVILFYLLVGGRVYCSWVCPVNVVTDSAGWLRRKLGMKKKCELSQSLRFWILGMVLLISLVAGNMLWELVNPVTLAQRGLIYGMGMGWVILVGIFLYDLFWSRNGWCGHLCPMGAFYSLINRFSIGKVKVSNREACDDCMDCFTVCPEPQVIRPALKGEHGHGIVIDDSLCTNCGRCIDICGPAVFRYGNRFQKLEQ